MESRATVECTGLQHGFQFISPAKFNLSGARDMATRTTFPPTEKQKLMDIIMPLINRIESKETGTRATLAKQAAWRTVLEEFRAVSAVPVKSVTQIKSIWKNLKIKAKKDAATERKERKKTGGGTTVPMGTLSRMIVDLLPEQMNAAIEAPLDCDESSDGEENAVVAPRTAVALLLAAPQGEAETRPVEQPAPNIDEPEIVDEVQPDAEPAEIDVVSFFSLI